MHTSQPHKRRTSCAAAAAPCAFTHCQLLRHAHDTFVLSQDWYGLMFCTTVTSAIFTVCRTTWTCQPIQQENTADDCAPRATRVNGNGHRSARLSKRCTVAAIIFTLPIRHRWGLLQALQSRISKLERYLEHIQFLLHMHVKCSLMCIYLTINDKYQAYFGP